MHTIDDAPDMTNPLSHVISYVEPESTVEYGDIVPFSMTGMLQGAEREHMIKLRVKHASTVQNILDVYTLQTAV